MTSNTMKKTQVTITVIAALLISTFAVLFTGRQAGAASYYAGPVYSSYEECDAGRVTYNSSWTRASQCFVQYGWDPNTQQDVYMGYSFTVTSL